MNPNADTITPDTIQAEVLHQHRTQQPRTVAVQVNRRVIMFPTNTGDGRGYHALVGTNDQDHPVIVSGVPTWDPFEGTTPSPMLQALDKEILLSARHQQWQQTLDSHPLVGTRTNFKVTGSAPALFSPEPGVPTVAGTFLRCQEVFTSPTPAIQPA